MTQSLNDSILLSRLRPSFVPPGSLLCGRNKTSPCGRRCRTARHGLRTRAVPLSGAGSAPPRSDRGGRSQRLPGRAREASSKGIVRSATRARGHSPRRCAPGKNPGADTRSDSRHQVGRVRVECPAHLSDRFLYDALEGAAPSRVHGCDSPTTRVRDQDGHAICGSYGRQDTRLIGQEGVARGHAALVCLSARGATRSSRRRCNRRRTAEDCGAAGRTVFNRAVGSARHPKDVRRVGLAQPGE